MMFTCIVCHAIKNNQQAAARYPTDARKPNGYVIHVMICTDCRANGFGFEDDGAVCLQRTGFKPRRIRAAIQYHPEDRALMSKRRLARQWLVDHPEDMAVSTPQLEVHRRPAGIAMSYQTWHRAKRELADGSETTDG